MAQVDPRSPRVDRAQNHRLKLNYGEALSKSAFNFKLCRYIKVGVSHHMCIDKARRCRLNR